MTMMHLLLHGNLVIQYQMKRGRTHLHPHTFLVKRWSILPIPMNFSPKREKLPLPLVLHIQMRYQHRFLSWTKNSPRPNHHHSLPVSPHLTPLLPYKRMQSLPLLVESNETLNHLIFATLKLMAKCGFIPKDVSTVDPPFCPGYAYGKARCK